MNRDILQGNWKQFKGEARRRWGKLTDDDLDVVKGDAEILIGKVQERYGQRQDQAERDVNDWLKTMGPEPQPGERK
jgi:uncharacterized protein YjbJ (UPF0337 family)